MARVVVVGGAGTFGQHGVRMLVQDGMFSEVVVADINKEKAQALAAELDSSKVNVTAKHVDIEDPASLMNAITGAQLIVNQSGPYNRYGVTMVKAAIEAKINYVDMNDDEVGIVDVLALDEEAKKAGVTCLVSFSMAAGITNMWARDGANRLDTVDEITVIIGRQPIHGWGPAVLDHLIHDHSGEANIYEDGEYKQVPVFCDQETFEIPSGMCTIGVAAHPEPTTLPRFIKGVRKVSYKSGYIPSFFQELWTNINVYGLSTVDPVNVGGVSVIPRDFIVSFLSQKPGTRVLDEYVNQVPEKVRGITTVVRLRGTKGGQTKTLTYRMFEQGFIHSIYKSVITTAEMLFAGDLMPGAGVFVPEQLSDPRPLLDRIAATGVHWTEEEKDGIA